MEEIWKKVKGYENLYEISNTGKIKSLRFNKEKILKPALSTSGYFMIALWKDKKPKYQSIHSLIAINFLNYKITTRKIVVDHIDNNKLNNCVKNIQIISNRENSFKDKKSKSGEYNIYLNSGAYLVRMRINGVKQTFGTFKNIEDAIIKRNFVINKLK